MTTEPRDPCPKVGASVTCEFCAEFLMDYLDGKVSDEVRFTFESHVAHCTDCEVYLAKYRATIELTRHLAEPPNPPEPMPEALERAILEARRRAKD